MPLCNILKFSLQLYFKKVLSTPHHIILTNLVQNYQLALSIAFKFWNTGEQIMSQTYIATLYCIWHLTDTMYVGADHQNDTNGINQDLDQIGWFLEIFAVELVQSQFFLPNVKIFYQSDSVQILNTKILSSVLSFRQLSKCYIPLPVDLPGWTLNANQLDKSKRLKTTKKHSQFRLRIPTKKERRKKCNMKSTQSLR